jgi:hypothetical protein
MLTIEEIRALGNVHPEFEPVSCQILLNITSCLQTSDHQSS